MPIPLEKVLEAAKIAGFGTELKVAAVLSGAGWKISQNVYFIDADENKGRELDVHARRYFGSTEEKPEVTCTLNLCIEVKRAADPYIFYSTKPEAYERGSGYGLFHWKNWIGPDPLPYLSIERDRPKRNPQYIARSYSCLKDGKSAQIQAGILSSFKYAIYKSNNCNETYSDHSSDICFFVPIVVVEGAVFECFIEEGEREPTAREVGHVTYRQNYQSTGYGEVSQFVHVVTLDHLEQLLSEFAQWGESMFSAMKVNRGRVKSLSSIL